jgi:hypothetical protein
VGHAVTITGYSYGDTPAETTGLYRLKSDYINKFYAHDDQIGPFSRILFRRPGVLVTSSYGDDIAGTTEVTPRFIIIPVYHKIRIRYENIAAVITLLTSSISRSGLWKEEYDWAINLHSQVDYKKEIRDLTILDEESKTDFLTRNCPRFIWVSRLYSSDSALFDIVWDATGFKTSKSRFAVLSFNEEGQRIISSL